ncbi:MAG: hypothetical protein BWY82_02796 [Verrucomicrobia bacterium ADurb.Bin474]|nr:MAG: hypothetical protein BWY82_02796 [Verrucomicrobia bacterium ADurb.Bin474]
MVLFFEEYLYALTTISSMTISMISRLMRSL